MDLSTIGLIVTWIGLGLICWLGYLLFLQHGRLLVRLEALEQRSETERRELDDHPPGLVVGSVAFDFDLPDLEAGRSVLSQWRGQQLLLVFVDPRCSHSRNLLPSLAAISPEPAAGQPLPLIVSTGDVEENRRWMQEHGVRWPVLVQDEAEVASLYHVDGTPSGYLIDEAGRTASALAVGAEAILRLATSGTSAAPSGWSAPAVTPTPARSRLVRDGLSAGTPAPAFQLPRLDGGELTLDALRGRPVLLVFSDPACGPCDELAPQLERVHRQATSVQLVMIGRGDPAENRAKARAHGLTFPIALQRRWELSREYGIFATPIAYLLDEHGVIVSGVAVGADAILKLAARAVDTGTRGVSSRVS